jgi:hypothetical protein
LFKGGYFLKGRIGILWLDGEKRGGWIIYIYIYKKRTRLTDKKRKEGTVKRSKRSD